MADNKFQGWHDVRDNRFYKEVTIANGGNLAPAADLGGYRMVGVGIPAIWTAAALTFQVSADGTNYKDLYDTISGEVSIPSTLVTAGKFLGFDSYLLTLFSGHRFIKVRSGTAAVPVNQGQDSVLGLLAVPYFQG